MRFSRRILRENMGQEFLWAVVLISAEAVSPWTNMERFEILLKGSVEAHLASSASSTNP